MPIDTIAASAATVGTHEIMTAHALDVATTKSGSWASALWLAAYAATFSFAYVRLPTGVGVLLLFGSVQATTVGASLWQGERLSAGL